MVHFSFYFNLKIARFFCRTLYITHLAKTFEIWIAQGGDCKAAVLDTASSDINLPMSLRNVVTFYQNTRRHIPPTVTFTSRSCVYLRSVHCDNGVWLSHSHQGHRVGYMQLIPCELSYCHHHSSCSTSETSVEVMFYKRIVDSLGLVVCRDGNRKKTGGHIVRGSMQNWKWEFHRKFTRHCNVKVEWENVCLVYGDKILKSRVENTSCSEIL